MIETRGLCKSYGRTTALDGLDLEIGEGELFGFIGPNGAGKTTTIRILATLLAPTSGEARICGFDVRQNGSLVRGMIGYLPDFFGLYEGLRVSEYLEFFAAAYEVAPKQRAGMVQDVLELTDLVDKKQEMVGGLSRGMQQRLGLARVLIHDPKVLLLDEPASGLDPRARVEMREILRELRTMGKTILLSSHILTELAEICTSVGILHDGRLLLSGPVDDVLARAASGSIVHVTVEAGVEKAVEELAGWDAVEWCETEPSLADSNGDGAAAEEVDRDGPRALRLELRNGLGPSDVAAFLVQRGYRLTALSSERPDLEAAYLRLTDGEGE